jgi:hypothetical protein
MAKKELDYDIDNVFVAPYVEFEITDAERDLIETALIHLRNNFESIRQEENSDVASVAAYRKTKVEQLLEKFESIHELRHKNES